MTYCYKCQNCGRKLELSFRTESFCSCVEGQPMVRDYRTEAVGAGAGVAMSRTGTVRDQARLFLPSNDDFKGPSDPDGTKGAREWLDTHEAKEPKGHNPLLDIERRSF